MFSAEKVVLLNKLNNNNNNTLIVLKFLVTICNMVYFALPLVLDVMSVYKLCRDLGRYIDDEDSVKTISFKRIIILSLYFAIIIAVYPK